MEELISVPLSLMYMSHKASKVFKWSQLLILIVYCNFEMSRQLTYGKCSSCHFEHFNLAIIFCDLTFAVCDHFYLHFHNTCDKNT